MKFAITVIAAMMVMLVVPAGAENVGDGRPKYAAFDRDVGDLAGGRRSFRGGRTGEVAAAATVEAERGAGVGSVDRKNIVGDAEEAVAHHSAPAACISHSTTSSAQASSRARALSPIALSLHCRYRASSFWRAPAGKRLR